MARKKKAKPLDPMIERHVQSILDVLSPHIVTTNLGYGVDRIEFDPGAAETLRERLEDFKEEIMAMLVSEQERDGVGE